MKKLTTLFCTFAATPALFAQEEAPGKSGGYSQMLIMLAIAVVFFYFILLRPEKKRRKAAAEQRSSIQKGDKITAMGIIDDHQVWLLESFFLLQPIDHLLHISA